MMDCNGDPAAELTRLVESGEVAEKDRGRVTIWRWLTREEALARGIVHPEPPKPQAQLPAPPPMKLLPAPPEPIEEPPKPPDTGKRGPLTEEQMRKMLEDRERPFGRPIKYPVVGLA
jgi:hypothetical protein